ncbi:hypothetical protein Pcinc_003766 [Petrolisthes cinctipes]|uniref:Helix-turn-helix domain-containing protein n=1 Tax=Petrolisthes cinctipes TaxID=88211 RepID=A0AAE1GIG6_PETCI|nr:hypothetical protein Pcinc_003766 [Petrolisthes cinctipes]
MGGGDMNGKGAFNRGVQVLHQYHSFFTTKSTSKMNGRHHDSTARRARMFGMCEAGLSVNGAARMMGVSRSTVRRWRDRWAATGS